LCIILASNLQKRLAIRPECVILINVRKRYKKPLEGGGWVGFEIPILKGELL
jgi:hypothetical protein